jgi:1-acyl-sn-glycerol-3-phosphate acyltransferase
VLHLANMVSFHVRFSGRENIPKEGGVLVVSNHQSHLDPPLIGLGCPRQISPIGRETLFDVPLLGPVMKLLGTIPIDREGMGISGIKESLRRLKHGELVLIFPEGTRSEDGQIAPFKPGFGTLAIRSRAYILPVAIEGAFACWPRSRKLPRLGRIRIHYGEPIPPDQVSRFDDRQLLKEVERRVHDCQAFLRKTWPATGV